MIHKFIEFMDLGLYFFLACHTIAGIVCLYLSYGKMNVMESGNQQITPAQVAPNQNSTSPEIKRQQRLLVGIIIGAVVLLILVIGSLAFLLNPNTDTEKIRDVFIIFMSLEMMFLGFILVILIIQMARLINLLQNEVKPILDSTNETVNTLRGTTMFLSENLVEPVIKANQYTAGIRQGLIILGLLRRKSK